MPSARTTVIDSTGNTVLAVCPFCEFRDIGSSEQRQRVRLLMHLESVHDQSSQTQRDSIKRWLSRRGVAA